MNIEKLSKKINKHLPLIKGFRATNIRNAFILNALSASLIAVIAIQVKQGLDKKFISSLTTPEELTEEDTNIEMNNNLRGFITWIVAFISALATYTLLYIMFGYGGGMLA